MTIRPVELARSAEEFTPSGERKTRLSYLPMAFAFLLMALPYEAVLPGPLRGNGSPTRLLGLTMMALFVIAIFANRRFLRSQIAAVAGVGIVVAYVGLSLFMYAKTYNDYYITENQAAAAQRFMAGTFTCLGIVGYIILKIRTPESRIAIIWAFVAGSMVSVVIGLIQGVSSNDYRYLLVPPGFELILEKGTAVREGFTRVIGTAGHPIGFSLTVAVALPLAIHLSRFARTRNQRAVGAVFTVILLVAIPASVSRTAVVAVAASLIIYAVVLPVRALIIGLFVMATAIAAYAVLAPQLFDAVVNLFRNFGSDDSITGRTDDYAVVGDAFRESPWIGYGLGNTVTEGRYLDNQWLQAILAGGIVGVATLVLLVIGSIFGVAHSLRQCDPDRPQQRDLVYALAGGLTSMIVATFIFDEFSFSQSALSLFLLYALVWTFHGPASAQHGKVGAGKSSTARGTRGTEPTPSRSISWGKHARR